MRPGGVKLRFGSINRNVMYATRIAPLEMSGDNFRTLGHELVDTIGAFLDSIRERPVTRAEPAGLLAEWLGKGSLPENGSPVRDLLRKTAPLLFDHSLLNGHPKFFGYITSSPAPLGALADMLAAIVNPNVGAGVLSPMASQIEQQTIRWLCEFIGVRTDYGGLLVSGGNMANFNGYLTGLTVKSDEAKNTAGTNYDPARRLIYCPKSTHTWIEKAVALFGPGKENLRWIDIGEDNRMNTGSLSKEIATDLSNGYLPLMVVGTAGDVSTGATDDLKEIAAICRRFGCWFHLDGAYGMPASVLPELATMFDGTAEADSIALDPHKWLYSPLEAGCTLVKNRNHMLQTFSAHPVYYDFDTLQEPETINYYEYGLQNSRGFRALKVWLALQQAGRSGYRQMIRDDIAMAALLYALAEENAELEAVTHNLSITTFRYVPGGCDPADDSYMNKLNEVLRKTLEQEGQVFFSNALVRGRYCLRACVVNFRTNEQDVREAISLLVEKGKAVHQKLSGAADRSLVPD